MRISDWSSDVCSSDLLWIAGNHDGLSGGAWGGEVADEITVDGIVFRHQSLAHETRPEISGHFHPKLRFNVRGRAISRPCFAGDAQRLILPDFGSLPGGLAADAPVIAENIDEDRKSTRLKSSTSREY